MTEETGEANADHELAEYPRSDIAESNRRANKRLAVWGGWGVVRGVRLGVQGVQKWVPNRPPARPPENREIRQKWPKTRLTLHTAQVGAEKKIRPLSVWRGGPRS